jgi:hypothetical protein
MHFLPVPFVKDVVTEYLPSSLTHDDYPNLISRDQTIRTIADRVVLIGYNWPRDSDRFRRVQRFVEAFFPKIAAFQNPTFHPKWGEISVYAKIEGWKRFDPAEEWLSAHANGDGSDAEVAAQLKQPTMSTSKGTAGASSADSDPAEGQLFQEFLRWKQTTGHGH